MIDAKNLLLESQAKAIAIHVVSREAWQKPDKSQPAQLAAWAKSNGFEAAPLSLLLVPDTKGDLSSVWVGAPLADADPFSLGALASKLPEATYVFAKAPANADLVALGWMLELYKYDPHRPTRALTVPQPSPRPMPSPWCAIL
jgi:leucyl aminopeptidase